MRRIGTLDDERLAKRFSDYLESLGIESMVDRSDEGWHVWVYDEDKVTQARQEFAEFERDPTAARFVRREREGERRRAERERERALRKTVESNRWWDRPFYRRCPVTFGLLAISVLVAILTNLGTQSTPVLDKLLIQDVRFDGRVAQWQPGLTAVRQGQVWRLVTPIFIHFGWIHLLFNMWMTYVFGSAVEYRLRSWKTLLLVLLVAVPSNVAQYYYDGPMFGGMSGVLYGLFGYIWMRSWLEPESGFVMPRDMVFWLLGWFVLCLVGIIPNAANVVHGVGLGVGVLVGAVESTTKRR